MIKNNPTELTKYVFSIIYCNIDITQGMFMKKLFLVCCLVLAPLSFAAAYPVAYNVNTRIYHDRGCEWARKCTKNCVVIDHNDAIRRGGRPCKVCHGR